MSIQPAAQHVPKRPPARIRVLELEVARLTEQLAEIRRVSGVPPDARPAFGLGKSENIIFLLLMKRDLVSEDAIRSALYGHRLDEPETDTVAVFLSMLRRKLPAGVKIRNEPRIGWSISTEHKKLLRAEMAAP